MSDKIRLLKNNDQREWDDTEWIEEFFLFLQGTIPEGITMPRGHKPKMSPKKAWSIIWFLQEKFPLIPDQIEKCSVCNTIYNSWNQGYYSEKTGKCYCGSCMDDYFDDDN